MTLRERWLLRRNAILANPRFQRWSMRLPLLRGTARHHADEMFRVITGFVYTKTLTAVVDAGVVARLAAAPASTAELAEGAGLELPAMQRLLSAAASIDLVEALPGDRWTLGQRGAALSSNTGALAMIEHHKLFYADLADPMAMFRNGRGGGALAQFWSYAEAAGRGERASAADPGTEAYSTLMAASQPMVAEQVLDAYDFGRHRRLLDIGGGHGAFVAQVAARHPGLALSLFDLPPVADMARQVLAGRGLGHVTVHGGSFRDDPIPPGADLVSLVRILHDHDDAVVAALLAAVHAALPAGGALLIAEPMAGTPGAQAMGDAYFGLYLWAMGSGRPRTAETYTAMLRTAGFGRVREVRVGLPMVTRLLVATR
ncbi:methyltransferase [Sandarakinorhabdus sp. DWP1-3-1]|uniref:methyltransferase n=1 Tax=Sandarakinorhabdus sp. DWP1-3-1 TaxID=2804627 RepID=UPI003CE68979